MKLRITTLNRKCRYADCQTFYCYAECRSAECHYVECEAPMLNSFLEHLRNLIYNFKYILDQNTLAYFAQFLMTKKKRFITLALLANFIKLFLA